MDNFIYNWANSIWNIILVRMEASVFSQWVAFHNINFTSFQSGSQLVRPKDADDPTKQDGVVYRIPCECGKVYI